MEKNYIEKTFSSFFRKSQIIEAFELLVQRLNLSREEYNAISKYIEENCRKNHNLGKNFKKNFAFQR